MLAELFLIKKNTKRHEFKVVFVEYDIFERSLF